MQYCKCHNTLSLHEALKTTWDEVVEFVAEPSKDEASDIVYGLGRVLGALINRPYVRLPGDGIHVRKIQKRMDDYGCIRSKRHLLNGKCPSE